MNFKIFDGENLINTIEASEAFCTAYCKKNGYTFEEVPNTSIIETELTEADDTAAMLVDHEYRLTLLELGLTE